MIQPEFPHIFDVASEIHPTETDCMALRAQAHGTELLMCQQRALPQIFRVIGERQYDGWTLPITDDIDFEQGLRHRVDTDFLVRHIYNDSKQYILRKIEKYEPLRKDCAPRVAYGGVTYTLSAPKPDGGPITATVSRSIDGAFDDFEFGLAEAENDDKEEQDIMLDTAADVMQTVNSRLVLLSMVQALRNFRASVCELDAREQIGL